MDEEISQFISITGADSDKARFFVESAQGNVETAVSTYFETEAAAGSTSTQEDEDEELLTGATGTEAAGSSGPRTLSGAPAPDLPRDWQSQTTSASRSQPPRQGGITSLRDLRNTAEETQGPPSGDGDEEDEDGRSRDPAHFYTGGERSGLSVENPNRRGGQPDIVRDILKKAAEAGQRAPEEDWGNSGGIGARGRDEGGSKASTSSFRGAGRTIGDSGPSNADASNSSGQGNSEEDEDTPASMETAIRHIVFWQDGFTIEDGPLCRYDDPRHADTLAALNNNRAPLQLLNVAFGQPVELRVDKRTNEKYKYVAPPLKAFSGSGNRLGSPAPALGGSSSSTSSTAPQRRDQMPDQGSSVSSTTFAVDPSRPTTQVQIRLGDGQRLVGRFNHDHTISDMRRYINASHPGMAARSYTLQSSFPPQPLQDENLTLKEAGLINAVVIQKWN